MKPWWFRQQKTDLKQPFDTSGFSHLHFAIYHGNMNYFKNTLKHKSQIESKDSQGFTPLHLAVYCNNLEAVELLLNNQANIEAMNNCNQTPLHIAAKYGFSDITELLYIHGAETDIKDSDGKTAFHLACESFDPATIALLLEEWPSFNTLDNFKHSPALEKFHNYGDDW